MWKQVALALCLAVLTAGLLFSSIRVIMLTGRVERLESARSRQGSISFPRRRYVTYPAAQIAPADWSHHKVLQVIDGDTILIDTAQGPLKLRVIGIDAPETMHPARPIEPYGPEASARARELLEGQEVQVQYDPDPSHGKWGKYARLLAYIELPDGRDFGLVMISEGLARTYTEYPFSRMQRYLAAEAEAHKAGQGLWRDPNG